MDCHAYQLGWLVSRRGLRSGFGTNTCFWRGRAYQHKKNANIFIDVDFTLVDANGRLLEGAREALVALKKAGCHLFLWSSVGAEYCRKVADAHHITDLFEGFSAKPDIAIDDMPSTCVPPFIYDVQREPPWPTLARRIIDKHVDK